MPNPILEQMERANSASSHNNSSNPNQQLNNNLQAIKEMMNLVRNSNNPMATLQTLAAQNPNFQQAFQLIQQNGGNLQQTFLNLARQQGIDPISILQALK